MTASKPDTVFPVAVRGDLRIAAPSGRVLTLTAGQAHLLLTLPGWTELHGLGPRSLLARRRALQASIKALRTLNLSLRIDVAGQRALELGAGVRTSLLARLLGLPSADLRFSTVVKLLRTRAAAA